MSRMTKQQVMFCRFVKWCFKSLCLILVCLIIQNCYIYHRPPPVPDRTSSCISIPLQPETSRDAVHCDTATGGDFTLTPLIDAIGFIESRDDPTAIGDDGDAVGVYQIHKIYVNDINRIIDFSCGKNSLAGKLHYTEFRFKYSDRKYTSYSRAMVQIYLTHYGGTFEQMARKHNGGPRGHLKKSTLAYWQKVKKRMEGVSRS